MTRVSLMLSAIVDMFPKDLRTSGKAFVKRVDDPTSPIYAASRKDVEPLLVAIKDKASPLKPSQVLTTWFQGLNLPDVPEVQAVLRTLSENQGAIDVAITPKLPMIRAFL